MNISQRQHLLAYLGYYTGSVDGSWGNLSREACRQFQQVGGIQTDGIGGPETDNALKYAVFHDQFKSEPLAGTDDSQKPGSFWEEIEFFTREEFRCRCGGRYCGGFPAEPQERMVRIADQLRRNLGVPVRVISGLRCPKWNTLQGGVADSQHMYGEAADICAIGISQSDVEQELDRIGGVRYHYPIPGSGNIHFDIPKGKR